MLETRFESLAEMPGIGRRREKCAKGVRSITEGDYVIIYRVKNDTVEILRVLHGARDPERVTNQAAYGLGLSSVASSLDTICDCGKVSSPDWQG